MSASTLNLPKWVIDTTETVRRFNIPITGGIMFATGLLLLMSSWIIGFWLGSTAWLAVNIGAVLPSLIIAADISARARPLATKRDMNAVFRIAMTATTIMLMSIAAMETIIQRFGFDGLRVLGTLVGWGSVTYVMVYIINLVMRTMASEEN